MTHTIESCADLAHLAITGATDQAREALVNLAAVEAGYYRILTDNNIPALHAANMLESLHSTLMLAASSRLANVEFAMLDEDGW